MGEETIKDKKMSITERICNTLVKTSVRAILALLFGGTACYAFLKGMVTQDNFMQVFMLIIAFFFVAPKGEGNGQ